MLIDLCEAVVRSYYHATPLFEKSLCRLPLSIEQTDRTFLFYVKQKFQLLSASDMTVTLLVDDIHLKRYFDYKGGTIVGSSYNSVCNAAKSAFAFMIRSVFCKYKDVVHLLPTCRMSASDINVMLKKLLLV